MTRQYYIFSATSLYPNDNPATSASRKYFFLSTDASYNAFYTSDIYMTIYNLNFLGSLLVTPTGKSFNIIHKC